MKPILFNTEMVKAILDGRKTVTRRVVKHDIEAILNRPFHNQNPDVPDKQIIEKLCQAPYEVGDILYVRETWMNYAGRIMYKADCDKYRIESLKLAGFGWHPSLHMPKKAARIFLKITGVRMEQLQDISEEQAAQGGAIKCIEVIRPDEDEPVIYQDETGYYVLGFKQIWNSTIGKKQVGQYGWGANPWVWVIEFERCEKGSAE